MTHSIDASFRLKKQAVAASRRRARLRKAIAALAVLVMLGIVAAFYYTTGYWSAGDYDGDLEFAEDAEDIPAEAPAYIPAIVDLPGDPMWISLSQESASASRVRTLARPAALDQSGISPEIQMLSDAMLSSSERFMTTIPSTQEDFAFFQAQRTVSAMPSTGLAADFEASLGPASSEPDGPGTEAAGWGQTISAGQADLPHFQKTEIENNTTVANVTPEPDRIEATRDFFVKVLVSRSIDSLILEEGFSSEDAKLAGEALKTVFARDGVQPGYVVALRAFRAKRGVALSLMQVSIYANDVFVGTLARNAAGAFVSSVDPWVRDDLFNYSGEPKDIGLKRQYRLLDAIYSTAARNNVPTSVIGEAIMYLSRGQDLNTFATHSDRLVLIYANAARGKEGIGGRVLYAGVLGGEKPLECYVYEQSDGEHACVSGDDRVHSLTITNGMATPVNGVMTSTFGPRKHPILKTVRIHKGVDWAAPVGTPIFAAFDGEIVFQGDGGGYGNLVRVAHEGERETRYAHLQRFEKQSGVGAAVKAGDVIGYVGTTGLSTGPHLHFELYLAGEAIDPLGSVTVASVSASDGSAVEILTDRIIQVESGGNARAKNPLSSATGLGQFIDSTWIRMMNTYRPDLARSLSRADLLALRFDVTISREMVSNLAREGEAYLRTRGHKITAGRLYLCHFLGMEGAHKVLAAPGGMALINALGAGVIRANPFLTGKDVSYVLSWAERKMTGRGRKSAASPVTVTREIRQTSPDFDQYKSAIAELMQSAQGAL